MEDYEREISVAISHGKGLVQHPTLGFVVVTVKSSAKRFIARHDNTYVSLTVPASATLEDVLEALEALTPRIMAKKSTLRYHDGQVLEFDGLTVNIATQDFYPEKVVAQLTSAHTAVIEVGSAVDFDSEFTTQSISDLLCRIAKRVAPCVLIPMAQAEAARVGVKPAGYGITSSRRAMGTCDRQGRIHLSLRCMFLPPHLRRYIICHELAHMQHFDHSPAFHALCDRYCEGHEAEYIEQMKRYKWPILSK